MQNLYPVEGWSDNKSGPIKLSVNFNRPKQQVKKAKKSSPAPVDSESDDYDSELDITDSDNDSDDQYSERWPF